MQKIQFKRRVFALFAVVLLLSVLALGCISSAWTVADIPFYNYFDVSKIKATDVRNNNAYVSSVNADNGTITISMLYNGRKGSWVVPAYSSSVTLRDLCPDIVAGETYILNGVYQEFQNITTLNRLNIHNSDTNTTVYWYFGTSMVVTADMLDSCITYYFGDIAESNNTFQDGVTYTRTLQLWINKGTVAQEFVQNNLFQPYYDEGYNNGYTDGLDTKLEDTYILTADNFEMKIAYYRANPATPEEAQQQFYILNNTLYKFDGFSFNSANLPQGFFNNFAPDILNIDYIMCTVDLSINEYNLSDFLAYFTAYNYSASNVTLYFVDGSYASYSFSNDGNLTLDGTKLSQTADNKTIRTLSFLYALPQSSDRISFSMVLGATDTLSYNIGFENGNSDGYSQGLKDGENIGYQKGQDIGYQNGYDYGYEKGQYDGYYQGKADEAGEGSFFKLIYATLDAPVQVLMDILNFEIFDFNLLNGFVSIISLALCFVVVSYVLKLVI